jgi:transcriptional regulator with XRE-family HTH domain
VTSLRDYPEEYKRFLERLRQARLEAGLTQTEVAEALQKPQSFVSKCETGERRIDVVELQVLANLYRVPLTYFVEEKAKEQHE